MRVQRGASGVSSIILHIESSTTQVTPAETHEGVLFMEADCYERLQKGAIKGLTCTSLADPPVQTPHTSSLIRGLRARISKQLEQQGTSSPELRSTFRYFQFGAEC